MGVSGKKTGLAAELYSEGDKCSETLRRSTYLVHYCNETATFPTLSGAREVETCVYVLDFFSREWCSVKDRVEFVLPKAEGGVKE